MDTGYIRLARKIFEWEWWGDPITLEVFIWCILRANWKEGKFKGQTIPRGSFVTSRGTGAAECRLSQQTWRTAIKHLISTNEITIKSTKQYTLITVVNYEVYQSDGEKLTNELTNDLTSNQPTTNQDIKKKKGKNKNINVHAEELFNQLWDLYIRKKGKSQVTKAAKEEILAVGYDRMKRCIEKYAAEKVGVEERYILMGSTFFNGRYKDYLDPEIAEPIPIQPEEEEEPEMTDEEFFAMVDNNFGEVG